MRRGIPVRMHRVPLQFYLAASRVPAVSSASLTKENDSHERIDINLYADGLPAHRPCRRCAAGWVRRDGVCSDHGQSHKRRTYQCERRSSTCWQRAQVSFQLAHRTELQLTITRTDPTFTYSYDPGDDGGDTTDGTTANRTVRRSVFEGNGDLLPSHSQPPATANDGTR